MKRKECESSNHANPRVRLGQPARSVWAVLSIAAVTGTGVPNALAGSARLWPSATVLEDVIRLTDLCELRGFELEAEQALQQIIVAEAPRAGGVRMIHMDIIRSALAASGANMATITLRGSTQCVVSRPDELAASASATASAASPKNRTGTATAAGAGQDGPLKKSVNPVWHRPGWHRPVRHRPGWDPPVWHRHPAGENARFKPVPHLVQHAAKGESLLFKPSAGSKAGASGEPTLRQAVVDYFNAELKRYGGTADVTFDRTSEQVLDLSGPTYKFRVRRRNGSPLGLTSVEVSIEAKGKVVQTVPLVVQVAMKRRAVAARRSINQGATIRTSDVDLVPLSVTRLDKAGVNDVATVIGQRAKRFIPVGSLIEPAMVEEVPLVRRGELVTIASTVGGIRVVTTAKAAATGLLGDVIKVRAADDKRVEFDAVVVGPGAVEVSSGASPRKRSRIAMRGGS